MILYCKDETNTSFADLPLNLTDYRLRMLPSGSEDTIAKTGIGTGPFMVDKFDAEGTTILKANPDYWEGAPGLLSSYNCNFRLTS